MLNMLINILQPTHPDDIKSWLVYAPEKGTEFFFLLKYWTSLHVLKIWCDWWFSCIIINKKKTTEWNKVCVKFLTLCCIYSIKCPGHLLNFWTFRVGAYSRLGAYFVLQQNVLMFQSRILTIHWKFLSDTKKTTRSSDSIFLVGVGRGWAFIWGWVLINFSCL